MKSIIILGDGMADEPIEALGGKTPMQYADTPYMDKLAALGVTGQMKTVADGFHPGSEVANMAVLGYDLPKVYEGRGVLEAASIGVTLQPGEMAMRCNLICVEGDILKKPFGRPYIHRRSRRVNTIPQREIRLRQSKILHWCLLPSPFGYQRRRQTAGLHAAHDVPLHPFRPLMVKPEVPEAQETADLLNDLILKSQEILKDHPVNPETYGCRKRPGKQYLALVARLSSGHANHAGDVRFQ